MVKQYKYKINDYDNNEIFKKNKLHNYNMYPFIRM